MPTAASAPAWSPQEPGVQQICYLLSEYQKPGTNQSQVMHTFISHQFAMKNSAKAAFNVMHSTCKLAVLLQAIVLTCATSQLRS